MKLHIIWEFKRKTIKVLGNLQTPRFKVLLMFQFSYVWVFCYSPESKNFWIFDLNIEHMYIEFWKTLKYLVASYPAETVEVEVCFIWILQWNHNKIQWKLLRVVSRKWKKDLCKVFKLFYLVSSCSVSAIKWVEICLGPGEGVGWLPLRTHFLTTWWRESVITPTPPFSSETPKLLTSPLSSCPRSSLDSWDTGKGSLPKKHGDHFVKIKWVDFVIWGAGSWHFQGLCGFLRLP